MNNAHSEHAPRVSHRTPSQRLPRLVRVMIGVFLSATLLFPACSGDDPSSPNNDSGKIRTGAMTQVFEQSVTAGTTVTVEGSGSPLDGMELEIPVGAAASAMPLTISHGEITGHEFGAHFTPITPLIRIENGGEFAAKPMRLRIPLPGLAGRFPVAFYYDRAAGTLEAIAPVGRSDEWLDVAVRHFSEIVVSATQIDLLREGGGFMSFFDPQANGWSFVNDGAYPEPGGICAGMSIGAAQFYRNFNASILLATHFDNDALWFPTPKIWEDDATGIKFCAELQRAFVTDNSFWTSTGSSPLDGFLQKSEEDHFWSLCYAMLVNNQPQFLYLSVDGDPSAAAHAILAYEYVIGPAVGTLKVYDPNYPGTEGTITFDFGTRKFRPYTSAANATALANGQTFSYDNIVFIPFSTICDAKEIDRIWQKVAAKTIGAGQYPAYELWAVPVDNDELPRVKLLDAASGKTTFLPYSEFTVEIVPADKSIPMSLTAWIDLPSIGEVEKQEPAGIITVERPTKDNLVGIQVNAKAAGRNTFSWAGFQWCKIRLQSLWIEPADTIVGVNQDLRLVVRHNGTAPADARFEWDFGDGETASRTGDSTITHAFEEQDAYTVAVTMFVPGSSDPAGTATATVQVTEWRSIMVTLSGMDTTPPSTIKTSDGQDIPNIIWSNRVGATLPLSWNKKEFSVDYSYNLSGLDMNTAISGRLAEDGKSIAVLTAITSGIGYGGDYTFTSSVALTNFPIEVIPGMPMGSQLRGSAAQPTVSNLSWRQTSVDSQGETHVVTLGTIDWSSQETVLSVYFYR
ncbi:MAG: PKD domain-containing protein [Bacteroidota bacterium]|nr:PKD domain-containing protein [Bacteroidota bacterium]